MPGQEDGAELKCGCCRAQECATDGFCRQCGFCLDEDPSASDL
ncbi:hypothetical protein PF006_g11665 [Phytophthora fragariae]|uniref:Uncharacterized protein n=1 Tax=Phytophthora fragariae TaxID=53985 RepID=A0A6A3TXE5_9STRA|nr:hypothetical protein PF003_g36781 [Phytophthora fragariae]KAE9143295.1 hypothetical protein PF006_g11665 [Phytophthora fragariae]